MWAALRDLDSNQDNILQRDAYYHYTIPQRCPL